MLNLTLQEALGKKRDTTNHYLYLYRDGNTIFYVGRSTKPLKRMDEHMKSTHMDDLGKVINTNMPDSLSWIFEMYTLEDCLPLVRQYQQYSLVFYKEILQETQRIQYKTIADIAEEVMIEHYKPCLNVLANLSRSQLPEKYVKPNNVANKGIILGY
jgi:predicted GIY-YIG superfamily endonuclease